MTSHPPFKHKPDYRLVLKQPEYQKLAASQRALGYYNLNTLWLFRKAWLLSKKPEDWLNYLAFRHDLGYPLTSNQKAMLEQVFSNNWQLIRLAIRSNGAFNIYKRIKYSSGTTKNSEELSEIIKAVSCIQIVGNSANLIGKNFGRGIDNSELVIRFNHCFSLNAANIDFGSKIDLWVGAPDFKGLPPKAKGYLMSGPDMLNWRPNRPKPFAKLGPLEGFPLVIWRKLVREIAAPPSAGLLTCSWLIQSIPSAEKWLCGFDLNDESSQYHHSSKQYQASSRHNWVAERQLLKIWLLKKLLKLGCRESSN